MSGASMEDKLTATDFSFSDDDMPVRMGRYHLLSRLSRDPIGEEFLALWGLDDGIEQLRVVRCIYPRVAREAEFIGLFSEEARVLSRLASANIARIMEVNIDGEIPFVAREHVEGLSLARIVKLAKERSQLWPWHLALFVTTEVLRGLDYVHRREDIHGNPMGMRHGDLRPENILVSFGGEVKLTNFGSTLGFIVDDATHARLSLLRGAYQPPEAPDEPSVAGDLWAAAMVMVQLLGADIPRSGTRTWRPPRLADRVPGLPDVVDGIVARALNPQAEYRFSTAAALRSALVEALSAHSEGHLVDELAAWTKKLGVEDSQREQGMIRRMMSKESDMVLGNARAASATVGPGFVLDDRYLLERCLGEGGMGAVYEAQHLGLNKKVAVKVLHDRVMSDTNTVERFKREAQIIGQLGHPNVVSAMDFGVSDQGHYYLVMDLLEGEPLSARIHRGDMGYRELAECLAGVCDGLQAAHDAGVIHRDLKPDNVFLTPQGPRILDFGIAKTVGLDQDNDALTRTGHICGTVDYIAPEQIRGAVNDPRSDLFAVGVILYEALTGTTPFHGKTVGEALHKAINDKLVSPSKRSERTDIPPQLEAVCIKALKRNVDKRFASAKEMAEALRKVARSLETPADVPAASGAPRPGRSRWVWAGAAVAVAAAAVAVWRWGGTGRAGAAAGAEAADSRSPAAAVAEARPAAQGPRRDEEPPASGKAVPSADVGKRDALSNARDAAPPDTAASRGQAQGTLGAGASVVQVVPPSTAPVQDSGTGTAEDAAAESLRIAQEQIALGDAALRRHDYAAAQAAYKKAVHHNHRESAAWFGLGKARFATGDYDGAITALVRAIRYGSGSRMRAYRNFLGVVYQAAGAQDKAVEQWRKVLQIWPQDSQAKRYLQRAGAL